MTQYNTLNVKFSDSKVNKVKSRRKYGTEVTESFIKFDFNNNSNDNG